jgi:anti-anti-sigma regulatory factor
MAVAGVSVKVLSWEGVLSVERAKEVQVELLTAFAQASQVVVSVSLLDSVDLAIIQLLVSAWLEAHKTGKTFHLGGTVRPEFLRALHVSGFVSANSENVRGIEAELFVPGAEKAKER